MNQEELKSLIQEDLSIASIANRLGCTVFYIRYYLGKFGLKTKNQKKRNTKCICKGCGDHNPESFYGHRKSLCKTCFNKSMTEVSKSNKLKAIEYLGGKCKDCGYNKCINAFDLHHRDPSQKDFEWCLLKRRKWTIIQIELDKCDLLCANCHRERHSK